MQSSKHTYIRDTYAFFVDSSKYHRRHRHTRAYCIHGNTHTQVGVWFFTVNAMLAIQYRAHSTSNKRTLNIHKSVERQQHKSFVYFKLFMVCFYFVHFFPLVQFCASDSKSAAHILVFGVTCSVFHVLLQFTGTRIAFRLVSSHVPFSHRSLFESHHFGEFHVCLRIRLHFAYKILPILFLPLVFSPKIDLKRRCNRHAKMPEDQSGEEWVNRNETGQFRVFLER